MVGLWFRHGFCKELAATTLHSSGQELVATGCAFDGAARV